jgi:hypothetical protein
MRTFSILVASAMLVAAFGSASMAEEQKACAGQYDSKAGTTFGRCEGTPLVVELQGAGAGAAAGASGGSGGSSGGSATGGNR